MHLDFGKDCSVKLLKHTRASAENFPGGPTEIRPEN